MQLALGDFNDQGHVAFTAGLAATDTSLVIGNGGWVDRGHGLELIASTQTTLPGTGESFNFLSQVLLNDVGDLAVIAGNSFENHSIYSEDGIGFTPVARTGEIAPGANQEYVRFKHLKLNNDRTIVFTALLRNDADRIARDAGIWTNETGVVAPIAFTGQEITDGEFIVYLDASFGFAANHSGDVAFMAASTLPNSNDDANSLWKYHSGQLNRIVQDGDIAPGTNTTFAGRVRSPVLDINEEGQVSIPVCC